MNQRENIILSIIGGKRGAQGTANAQGRQQRLGAVLSGTQRNTRLRQQGYHIAVMYAGEVKRQQAGLLTAEGAKAWPLRQLIFRQRRQATAPAFGLGDIGLFQPLQRRAQADHPGDIGRLASRPPDDRVRAGF